MITDQNGLTRDNLAATKRDLTAETRRPQRKNPQNRTLCELRASAVKKAEGNLSQL